MINIYINGREVVCESNFTITEEHLKTSSVILNKVYPKDWKGTDKLLTEYYFPKDYSSCEIYIDSNLVFCGIVKNSGEMVLNPFMPHYCSLLVLDYKTLLSESNTLDFVISNKTVSQAITQVIDYISDYGFVVGNIDISDNSTIGAYSTLDKTPYDVFQYLAEISGSLWTTRFIDKDTTAIDFYDPDDLINKPSVDFTQSYFETNKIEDISYSYSTNDYRNKQTILSDLVFGNIDSVDNLFSNGYSTSYNTIGIIGIVKEILVDGVSKSFATNSEKNIGIYADFYYTQGESTFESSDTYTSGTNISIEYTPLVKGRQVVYNNNEISRIGAQTSRNGTISRYETRSDVLSSDELSKIANTYIKYNGKPEITLTIISRKSDLFNIGDKTYFNIDGLDDLKTDYLVTRKETMIRLFDNEVDINYTYSLSNNFNMETDINYFDNQRRKSKGNINENEFITRNIDIDTEIQINFKELSSSEITVIGDNILNCGLNSPLNN